MRVDRSFANQPPICVTAITTGKLEGGSWAGIGIDLAQEVRIRDICLKEVAAWISAEKESRVSGAPGT